MLSSHLRPQLLDDCQRLLGRRHARVGTRLDRRYGEGRVHERWAEVVRAAYGEEHHGAPLMQSATICSVG